MDNTTEPGVVSPERVSGASSVRRRITGSRSADVRVGDGPFVPPAEDPSPTPPTPALAVVRSYRNGLNGQRPARHVVGSFRTQGVEALRSSGARWVADMTVS